MPAVSLTSIFTFIRQCKAKDQELYNVSLPHKAFASIKYDGYYCQIHKQGKDVLLFTSGGHPFTVDNLDSQFTKLPDGMYEAEFIGKSEGKLGDRVRSAALMTYKNNYSKGFSSSSDGVFKIFDAIKPGAFEERLEVLRSIKETDNIHVVAYSLLSNDQIEIFRDLKVNEGYEGIMLKLPSHIYEPGKRLATAIKLKRRYTADLICTDIMPGEGKYEGLIGSLKLVDSKNRVAYVGSGLTDSLRMKDKSFFIGKTIEIGFERITNDAYIQPVFKEIRNDKL